jgi:hypothetical protein
MCVESFFLPRDIDDVFMKSNLFMNELKCLLNDVNSKDENIKDQCPSVNRWHSLKYLLRKKLVY